jgi:hypothetical protein
VSEAPRPPASARNARLAAGAVALGLLAFYAWHLCPTTTWGDPAGLHDATSRPLGTGARDYPIFLLLLRAAMALPLGDPFVGGNLLTALFAAAAAGVLVLVVHRLTGAVVPAVTGALAFGLAHTPWTYAVVTEVYSLNHLFLALWLLLLLRLRDGDAGALAPLLLTAGLATAHHRLLALFVLPCLVFLLPRLRGLDRRHVRNGLLALVLGLLPLAWLAGRQLLAGAEPGSVLDQYLTGGIRKSLFNPDPVAFAKSSVLFLAYLVLNFPGPALLLALVGAWTIRRRDRTVAWLLALTFLVYAVFAIGYRHHGIWVAYASHAFLPLAVLAGVGADVLLRRLGGARWARVAVPAVIALVPALLYPALPPLLRAAELRPFRTPDADAFHRWYLDPSQRGDTAARDTGRAILDALPPDTVLLGDWGVASVLRLLQHREGRRPDVLIVLHGGENRTSWVREHEGRPLYLAHFPYYEPRFTAEGRRLRRDPSGLPLHEIVPTEPASGAQR